MTSHRIASNPMKPFETDNTTPRRILRKEPAIWAARHVEWPIPSSLNLANYQKLVAKSRQVGTSLGITEEAPKETEEDNYFSGLIGRVLNTKDADTHETSQSVPPTGSRPLRPPRCQCVATGNSWMVAALECPAADAQTPALRLVSRWNVRRTSGVDSWMALPPPIAGGDGRIQHVFCDPTGCHTLISAKNGEAYYHHSSDKSIQKLAGFGRGVDGNWPLHLTGVPATATPSTMTTSTTSTSSAATRDSSIQTGLSKGSYVTAVAWDRERGTEGSTKKIILGTSTGEIYEYALVTPNNVSENQDDVMDQPVLLHKLHSEAAVTGLAMERLRTGILILCCTSGRGKPTRFYTFYSAHSTSLTMVLADEHHATVVDLPGSIDHADFLICNDHLAMRTAAGIYYGTIDRTQSGPALAGGSMIVDSGILPYSEKSGIPVSLALTPHHIITLSESNEVRFLNRVAQKVIQKEKVDWVSTSSSTAGALDEGQMGTGELMMDVRRPDQVWLRKARSLVHISSSQEDRDIWKYTLFKALDMVSGKPSKPGAAMSEEEKMQESTFEQAKNLCTHPSQKAVVTAVRAEYHLSQGRAELAAKYFAQCPSVLEPFSDTAVRLALPMLKIDDPQSYHGSSVAREALQSNTPLITYLTDKMRVGRNNNDKMTCTMIGAWLTELHLHERESSVSSSKQSLSQFLSSNVNNMDAKTIMKLLMSHDVSAEECAAYAAKSGDIATAFNAALRVGTGSPDGAVEALKILNDAPFELSEPLYYKYASALLSSAPVVAGKSFLSRYTHGLSPTRLLPAIMHYERLRADLLKSRHASQVSRGTNPFGGADVEESKTMEPQASRFNTGFGDQILHGMSRSGAFVDDPNVSRRYLEGVIKLGCRSSAIFSFLISLYVKMDDEEPLYTFLSTHISAASFPSGASGPAGLASAEETISGPLDMSYALRTILRSGRHFRSAIKLYMGFGMRQQAVELGLKVDPVLARELAQESVELEERRRLWLMIAKNAASEGVNRADADVVSKVVSVLKDCGPDVLSIEDVLPFLPDFAQIDQIKDEICEALTSYSSKIEAFLREMNECDETCDNLRGEISRLRTHRMEMKPDARCAFTGRLVLSAGEPFYVFPSGYVVLESSLKEAVVPFLNDKQKARVAELEKELKLSPGPGRRSDSRQAALQAEMDGLIAAECPLTGSIMVEKVDQPFPDSDEIDGAIYGRRVGTWLGNEAGTATV